jgi:hypothetical protein
VNVALLAPAARGLGLYLALCLAACLTGRGVMRLLRLEVEERAGAVLAPVLGFLFWVLSLGVLVGLRQPVRDVTPWLWGASGLLALWGLRRPWSSSRAAALPTLCLALPVLLMGHCFRVGVIEYTGSVALDGWTYMAGGHYYWGHARDPEDWAGVFRSVTPQDADHLWQYARTPAGDLPPADRVGSFFKSTRYISFALLGYLSPLARAGDTTAVAALQQAWVLFVMACAVCLFWLADRQPPGLAAAATALTVLSGWVGTAVWGNNLDQLLALVYMPALAAVVLVWGARDPRRWLLFGALLAAAWYSYPEGALLVTGGAGLVVLPRFWADRRCRSLWLGTAGALALAGLLLLPAAATLLTFVRHQYAGAAATGGRHGFDMYCGLLEARFQPAAFWGLGGETYAKPFSPLKNAWAVVLSVLLPAGLVALVRRRRWGVAAALTLLLSGAVYLLLARHYPYAAFKVLSLAWWLVVAAAVAGCAALLRLVPAERPRRGAAAALVTAALLLGFWANRVQKPLWDSPSLALRASAFRSVKDIRALVGHRCLLLAADDWLTSELALFHLRDVPLCVISPRAWLLNPEVKEYTHLADAVPPDGAEFVLTDANAASKSGFLHYGRLVRAHGPYRLWQLRPDFGDVEVVHVHNPYGLEHSPQGDFLWLGPEETVFYLRARRAGTAMLEAELMPGPCLPGRTAWDVEVSTSAGYHGRANLAGQHGSVAVPVRAGMNRVVLWPLDRATAAASGGDPRTLLLGLRELHARLAPE